VPNASSAGASASPDIGPHPHGRGGPGGLTAPLSSQPHLGLGAAIAAAFVRLHETWSSSVPGWTAAVGAAAALTVLLLTRLLLNRRGR
jgi:H+/Cl- antiporter ClcA